VSLAHVANLAFHLEDGTGNLVRHQDAGKADQHYEQRERRGQGDEHRALLTAKRLRLLLETGCLAFERRLLAF
jgi:hypothetical protein